jgi:hypothetical protein
VVVAYWLPRSEWASKPAAGRRRPRARWRASTTNRLSIVSAIDQPTIIRLNRSSTTARYNRPSRVGM